jgi:hypothetical protein
MIQGDTRITYARPLCDLAPSGEFLLLPRRLCSGFDSLEIAAVSQSSQPIYIRAKPRKPHPQCSP